MTRGLGGQRHAGEDSPLLGVVDMADESITSTFQGYVRSKQGDAGMNESNRLIRRLL